LERTDERSNGLWKWLAGLAASIIGPVAVFYLTQHGSIVAHGWRELVHMLRRLLHI